MTNEDRLVEIIHDHFDKISAMECKDDKEWIKLSRTDLAKAILSAGYIHKDDIKEKCDIEGCWREREHDKQLAIHEKDIDNNYVHKSKAIHKDDEKANLGLATTRELIDELRARIEIDGKLEYRTIDS